MAKRKSLKTRPPKVGCPFCWEWLPAPKTFFNVFSGEGCSGGHCSCGAVFVVDETGKSGGQAVLDVRALACDGDLDRALKLETDTDFKLKTKVFQSEGNTPFGRAHGHPMLKPKIWSLKLTS